MTNMYVGNLSSDVTSDELEQLFSNKGFQVASARVICDREGGRSRGFGFVELGSQDDAERAIQELNETDIKGRTLVVKEARPQKPRADRNHSRGFPTRNERAVTVRDVK
jgi:cold-inducible RNA-binding protein